MEKILGRESYRIVCIDNDHAFVPAVAPLSSSPISKLKAILGQTVIVQVEHYYHAQSPC